MNEEMLEILIGKFLDSEITPAEQKLLDAELQSNPKAKNLFQQWQQLHEQTEQVLTAEVIEKGQSPQAIFQRAVTVHERNRWKRRLRPTRWLPTIGSLAAGLLLGFGLFSLMADNSLERNVNPPVHESKMVKGEDNEKQNPESLPEESGNTLVDLIKSDLANQPVEYYLYTDPSGSRYVVETPTDNYVNLATYYDDLH